MDKLSGLLTAWIWIWITDLFTGPSFYYPWLYPRALFGKANGKNLISALHSGATLWKWLILEISENSAMLAPKLMSEFMADTQKKGISFAIDDFRSRLNFFWPSEQSCFHMLKFTVNLSAKLEQIPCSSFYRKHCFILPNILGCTQLLKPLKQRLLCNF